MRIKRHWQEIVQDILEFRYIDMAEDPEFKIIKEDTNNLTEVILVSTASEIILTRYEKILGLEAEQDIDIRRSNILNKLSTRTPFTKWWLIEKLDTLLGRGNYDLYINGLEYEIVVEVDMAYGHIFSSVQTQFIKQIPANMLLIPKLKITAPIGIETLSKAYRFNSPICEYLTGVYPYVSCLGKIDARSTGVGINVYGYLFDSDFAGTRPDISTLGRIDVRGLNADNNICDYLFYPDIAGTKPDISTLGNIAYEEAQTLEKRDVTPFSYKLCNTIKCGM